MTKSELGLNPEKRVLIPANSGGNHWILCVANLKACRAFNTNKPTCNHPHHHDGLVHVRATCKDILIQGVVGKDGTCGRAGCTFGHDFPDIRLAIHEARRWDTECKIILDEQTHQEVLDRGSLQAIAKEAKRAARR